MVPAYLRWFSDGRGGVRYRLERGFPRRGYGGQRGARTHLVCSSFRAFRFATRCPGGRDGLHQLPSTTKPAAAKREAIQCDNHPDEVGTIRHGTAVTKIAEEHSVPVGQLKSALAPIRRPPCARRATAPERAQAAFSFGPCTARFSFGATKEKWGVHPGRTMPPGGSRTQEAAVRRPISLGKCRTQFSPARRCGPADSPW